jgi:hypothetical protein
LTLLEKWSGAQPYESTVLNRHHHVLSERRWVCRDFIDPRLTAARKCGQSTAVGDTTAMAGATRYTGALRQRSEGLQYRLGQAKVDYESLLVRYNREQAML